MNTRDIHLRGVLDIFQDIKKNPQTMAPYKSFVLKAESELNSLDQELLEFFEKPDLRKFLSEVNRDEKTVNRFNEEYKLISRKLEQISKRIIEEIEQLDLKMYPELAVKLNKIAIELKIISSFIPDFRLKHKNYMVNLAKALGATDISVSQSELPTLGAEVNSEGKIERSGGICAGMVIEWAKQSVEKGTPDYPVTSNIQVINSQESEKEIMSKDYTLVSLELANSVDAINLLESMAESYPYQITIGSANADGAGHAIGIRKHPHYFEIFDPNYGYYFFKNKKEAALWVNALFREYEALYMPDMFVGIYKRNERSNNKIPDSSYPPRQVVDESSRVPFKSYAYENTIKMYREHLNLILRGEKKYNKNTLRLICSAIKEFNSRLHEEDSKLFIECLSDCQKGYEYKEVYGKFISENVYNRCLRENLIDLEVNKINIPEPVSKMINEVDEAALSLSERYMQLLNILNESRKLNLDESNINNLIMTLDIIDSRRKRLNELDIKSKLLEGLSGETSFTYTIKDAKDELNKIIKKESRNIDDVEYLKSRREIDNKINLAIELYKQLESAIKSRSSHSENIYGVEESKINDYVLEVLSRNVIELQLLKKEVLAEKSIDEINFRLNKILPAVRDVAKLEGAIKLKILPKYSDEEKKIINTLYSRMSDSPGSVRALVRQYKADMEEQKAVINYILEKMDKFREVLVDAVDPQKIKIYSIKELDELAIYFKKNNIEWFIAINVLADGIHQNVKEIEVRLRNKSSYPAFQEIFKKLDFLRSSLKSNKVSIEDYIKGVLIELGMPIVPDLMKKSVINFTEEFLKDFSPSLRAELKRRSVALPVSSANHAQESIRMFDREFERHPIFTVGNNKAVLDPLTNLDKIFAEHINRYLKSIENDRKIPELLIKIYPHFYAIFNKAKISQEDYLNNHVIPVMQRYLSSLPIETRDKSFSNLITVLVKGKKLFPDKGFIDLISSLEKAVEEFQVKKPHHKPHA